MATRKPDYQGSLADYKESVKPASKKEKLYGQELGKIGRAAERGGPVNTVQQKMGTYSEQVMQNKANRDMPVKRKVQEMGLQLGVAALTSPGTLRGVQSGVARVSNIVRGKEIMVHGSPVRDLKVIEPRPARFNPDVPAIYGISTTMPANRRSSIGVTSVTSGYAQGSNWMESVYGPKPAGGGSIYAVEVPRSSIKRPYDEIIKKAPRIINRSQAPMVYSEKPGKVVGEVKLEWRTVEEINNDVKKMLRRAGAPSQDPLINKVKEKLAKKVAKKPTKGRF